MSLAARIKRLLIGCFRLSSKIPSCTLTFNYRKSTCVGIWGAGHGWFKLSPSSKFKEKLDRKQIGVRGWKLPSSCLICEIPSGKHSNKTQVVDLGLTSSALKRPHFYLLHQAKKLKQKKRPSVWSPDGRSLSAAHCSPSGDDCSNVEENFGAFGRWQSLGLFPHRDSFLFSSSFHLIQK